MVERLFLAVPRGCLRFVIVVFPDHTHLLFLRTLVEIARLAERFNMRFKVEPGKLDIKRCKPGVLFSSLNNVSLF